MSLLDIFWKFDFLIALVIAEVLILHRSGRRRYFVPGFLIGLAPAALLNYFWDDLFGFNIWISASKFLVVFFCTFLMMAFSYKGDFWAYLFAGVMAYCAQHIAYRSLDLISTFAELGRSELSRFLLLASFYAAVYVCLYFVFVRRLRKDEPVRVNNRVQVVLSAVVLLITVYISFFGIVTASGLGSLVLRRVVALFSILSCFLGVMLEMSFVQLKQNETELAILRQMVHQAKHQYKESKESIDLINIKCHDLRHQMRRLSNDADREELEKIAQAIDIYDASLVTGNDALDIVLMDKGLRCREKGIRLTCMFDAGIVSGISHSDIYSLFGNAIENAMESVEGLDEEHRSISVVGYKQSGFSVIRVENYCGRKVVFEDGLPVTQKSKDYHGFGVKSIRLVAQRYGGELTMSQNGDIFKVEIVFPSEQPVRTA